MPNEYLQPEERQMGMSTRNDEGTRKMATGQTSEVPHISKGVPRMTEYYRYADHDFYDHECDRYEEDRDERAEHEDEDD